MQLAETYRGQFARLQSVHLVARYTLELPNQAGGVLSGSSRLEYWAAEDRFRIDSTVAPELSTGGFVGSQLLTFDGCESRLFSTPAKSLVVRSGEIPDSTLAPNPLFLPMSFLNIRSQACEDCRPSLADVRRSAVQRDGFVGARVVEGKGARGVTRLILQDRASGGTREVELSRSGASWWVSESTIRGPDGSLRERGRFSHPAVVPGSEPALVVPRRLVFESWGSGPGETARIEISVDEISANDALDPNLFTIPEVLADTVIDEDRMEVVRAPHCSAPR